MTLFLLPSLHTLPMLWAGPPIPKQPQLLLSAPMPPGRIHPSMEMWIIRRMQHLLNSKQSLPQGGGPSQSHLLPPQTERGSCWPGEVPYLSDTAHSWSIHSSGAMLWAQKAKLSLHSQFPNPNSPVPPTNPIIFCPRFPISHIGNASKSSQLHFLINTSNMLHKED